MPKSIVTIVGKIGYKLIRLWHVSCLGRVYFIAQTVQFSGHRLSLMISTLCILCVSNYLHYANLTFRLSAVMSTFYKLAYLVLYRGRLKGPNRPRKAARDDTESSDRESDSSPRDALLG